MKFTTKIMFIFIIISLPCYSDINSLEDLKHDLSSMLTWSTDQLMPRSKKDHKKGRIDNQNRDLIKKIHAYSDWLYGHMTAQINEGYTIRQIRDDIEQENQFKKLNEITLHAIWRTRNGRNTEKLHDLLMTFFTRFIDPIGYYIGYDVYGPDDRGYNPYKKSYTKPLPKGPIMELIS